MLFASKTSINLSNSSSSIKASRKMAHVSVRSKLICSNEGLSFGEYSRDQFRHMAAGSPLIRVRRSRLKLDEFRARVSSPYSFFPNRKKTRDLDNAEKNLVSEEDADDWNLYGDESELETDDLSCFRGLVLDISYRSSPSLLVHFNLSCANNNWTIFYLANWPSFVQ